MFASFPRWTSLAAPSVMEAMPDGSFEPYPGNAWNEWRPGDPAADRIVSSHAVFADSSNHLWVVDDAAPRVAPPVEGAAKLVKIDLGSDRVSRVYPLGSDILPRGTMIGHMRVDSRFAYVTEAHHGAIIVVDRRRAETRPPCGSVCSGTRSARGRMRRAPGTRWRSRRLRGCAGDASALPG